jgi:hypothetical protein
MLPFGFTNKDFNASNSIWNFLNSQLLHGCVPTGINEVKSINDTLNISPNPFESQTTFTFLEEQKPQQ